MKLIYMGQGIPTKGGIPLDEPGEKECPVCERVWMPTPFDDYFLPSCGCYGTSHDQRKIPCEACGLPHAWKCVVDQKKAVTN